jgi:CheY-like chemotaxis protein
MSNPKDTGTLELAEGTNDRHHQREQTVAQQTNTHPIMPGPAQSEAVTGALQAIHMQTDGAEDATSAREADDPATDDANSTSTDETQPTPQPTTEQVAPESDNKKPSVLIVEDTQELAEVIQATLENAGMQVEAVSHGAKGLEKVKTNRPDILLLDIGLPDMTGWKMLEELRDWKSDENKMPAVIVITAYGDPANRLIGKLQGIHSYLIKPFTSDEVEQVVRKALDAAN